MLMPLNECHLCAFSQEIWQNIWNLKHTWKNAWSWGYPWHLWMMLKRKKQVCHVEFIALQWPSQYADDSSHFITCWQEWDMLRFSPPPPPVFLESAPSIGNNPVWGLLNLSFPSLGKCLMTPVPEYKPGPCVHSRDWYTNAFSTF